MGVVAGQQRGPLLIVENSDSKLLLLVRHVAALPILAVALVGDGWPAALDLLRGHRTEPGGWLVRLDAEGITWRDGPRLGWPAIAEIHLPRRWPGRVRVLSRAQIAWAAKASARPRALTIPRSRNVTPSDIAAAVREWSNVPIR